MITSKCLDTNFDRSCEYCFEEAAGRRVKKEDLLLEFTFSMDESQLSAASPRGLGDLQEGALSPFSPLLQKIKRKRPVQSNGQELDDFSLNPCRRVSIVVAIGDGGDSVEGENKLCIFPTRDTESTRELIVLNPKAFGRLVPPQTSQRDVAKMVSQIAPLAQEDWTRTYRFQHVVWPHRKQSQPVVDSPIYREFPDNTLLHLCSGAVNDILAKDSTSNRIFVALGNCSRTETLFGSIATQKPSVAEVFAQSVNDLSREELLGRYGLLGWTVQAILDRLPEDKTAVCTLSIMEVSDENSLFDLLATRPFTQDASKRVTLRYNTGSKHAWSKDEVKSRGTGTIGAVIEGLSNQPIESLKSLAHSMRRAFAAALHEKRKTSRGTLVVSVRVWQQAERSQFQQKFEKNTCIQFVDLGGIESDDKPAYLKRNAAIRKSEWALGGVLRGTLLREAGHDAVIPYRESALTKVLQRSMDHPDSRTIVMASLLPHSGAYDESMSTLRYVSRLISKPGQAAQTSFDSIVQSSTVSGSPNSSAPLSLSHLTKEDGSSAYLLQSLLSDPRQRLAKLVIPDKTSTDSSTFYFDVGDDDPTPYKGPSSPRAQRAVIEARATSEDPKSASDEQRAPPGKHISKLTSQPSELSSTGTPSRLPTPLAENMSRNDFGASPPSSYHLRPNPPGRHLDGRTAEGILKVQESLGGSSEGETSNILTSETIHRPDGTEKLHQVNVSPILPREKHGDASYESSSVRKSFDNLELSSISRNISEDLRQITNADKKQRTPKSVKARSQRMLSPKFDSSVVQKSKKAMNFLRKTWSEDESRPSSDSKFANKYRDDRRGFIMNETDTSVDQAMNDLSFELLRRSKVVDDQKPTTSSTLKSELDDLSMELFGKSSLNELNRGQLDESSHLATGISQPAVDLMTPRRIAASMSSQSPDSQDLQVNISFSNSALIKGTTSSGENSIGSDLGTLQGAMEQIRLTQNGTLQANHTANTAGSTARKPHHGGSRRVNDEELAELNEHVDSLERRHESEIKEREREIMQLTDQLNKALAEKNEVVKIAEEAIMTQAELEERVTALERRNNEQVLNANTDQSSTNASRSLRILEEEIAVYKKEISSSDAKVAALQSKLKQSESERERLALEASNRQQEYVQLISKFDYSVDGEDIPISVQEDGLRRLLIAKDSSIAGLTEDKEKLASDIAQLMEERSAHIEQLEELEKELSVVKTERDDMAAKMDAAVESQESLMQELEETRLELDCRLSDVEELSSSLKKLLREKEEADALNERMEQALSNFESETRSRLDKVLEDRREAKSLLENTLRDNAKLSVTIKGLRESLESMRQESEEDRLHYEGLEQENALLREQNREMKSTLEEYEGRAHGYVPAHQSHGDLKSSGTHEISSRATRDKYDPPKMLSPMSTSSLRAEDIAAYVAVTAKASLDEKILLTSIGDAKDAEIEALRLRIRLLERRKADFR